MNKLACNKYLDHPKFFGVLFLLSIIVFCSNQAFADESFDKVFPLGKGSEIVTRNCTGCHSAEIVLQNSMTHEGWDETITVMQKKHGLWDLEPETRDQILNYLSTVRGISGKQSTKKKFKLFRFEYKPNPLQ